MTTSLSCLARSALRPCEAGSSCEAMAETREVALRGDSVRLLLLPLLSGSTPPDVGRATPPLRVLTQLGTIPTSSLGVEPLALGVRTYDMMEVMNEEVVKREVKRINFQPTSIRSTASGELVPARDCAPAARASCSTQHSPQGCH